MLANCGCSIRRQFYENKAAVLLLQNWICGDVIKSPLFKDMAVSRRYRYVRFISILFSNQ
ncbi:hypothetical protein DWX95_10935 [Butyricicoccus sp. AF22-28AC]|nr:hypothetical protein DXB94_03055 [Butyricicoccus sp. OM06-6AC]RHQ68217.1 hypothetical protein DWY17_11395 [Butyricicoccus sp. AF24-19AC]RHQ81180.1 hypothetical protein DWX95_10935 [Butyricicoccus sp. AF22-28AC]RHR87610.1 hypothetical protein DWW41_05690 [Butyricicoccus sp. AF15-40]